MSGSQTTPNQVNRLGGLGSQARTVALSELSAGSRGVIARIDEADHAMLIRLKTMGMHEGRAIRVVRSGTRIIASCGGTRIGLSAEVAKHVRVTPTA